MKDKRVGILFDLDGTLWVSSVAVVESWNEVIDTLPDFHKKGTVDDITGLMGKTMTDIAYEFFDTVPKERALELMEMCTAHENDYIRAHGGILMPDLESVLEQLSSKYFLAIVSNCQQGYIEAFMYYHKLERYFDDKEDFGTTNLSKGENIRLVMERNGLERAYYVGDILSDMKSSDEAGSVFIHAAYGYGRIPEAKNVIEKLADLPECVDRLEKE